MQASMSGGVAEMNVFRFPFTPEKSVYRIPVNLLFVALLFRLRSP
ncbi:hypothetical protein U746_0918 [Mycolicibacterium mucogenicum 261Sha1.1M5]|nr:hypothetical protein U746_0918 [Mycolicibacterium mucogenicum 261Sha1.1M5]